MTTQIEINGRPVGPGHPVYIVAEMSANHNQDFNRAVEIVRAAKECGADAIKLQTYTPDALTIDCDKDCFRIGKGTVWAGRKLYDLYREAQTPWEWQPGLKQVAEALNLDFMSTPFDTAAIELLDSMNVPAYKIASFEVPDLQLIRSVAAKGKPLIISTGLASIGEIDDAVRAARSAGATQIALLKCSSAYPAAPGEMNLLTIPHLAQTFGVVAGLSDHTLGIAVPVVATSLGASIIEKHLTLSRTIPGPDSAFSLEPSEFRNMVEAVRVAEQALGKVDYDVARSEAASKAFRRSLFVVSDVRAGESFTACNVRSIRPGYGLPPKHLPDVIGKVAAKDIERGTPFTWDLVG
jgi:pseudaminic acid synthase